MKAKCEHSQSQRFALGVVLATPGALRRISEGSADAQDFLDRHRGGDWGDVTPEDAVANEQALEQGLRIISCYSVGNARIWIITEADRSATTLLLPSEY